MRIVDGETKLMGLLGEGLAYTKSPAMHNRAAELLGINAVYMPLSMPEADLEKFLDVAWSLGALGFNVTQPHKAAVAALFEGAPTSVNTLVRGVAGWQATSTDGAGFVAGLKRIDREITSFDDVIFIGNGGGVIGILEHLLETAWATMPKITVARRNSERDEDFLGFAASGLDLTFIDLSVADLTAVLAGKKDGTLLVQATSAPLKGDDLGSLVPALAEFSGALVDLVYGKPSALYFAACAKDLAAQDGEAMLIEQARRAEMLWWGEAASYDDLAAALRGKAT